MSGKFSAGTQLAGQTLFQRQKQLRAEGTLTLAPPVVAVHMSVPENMGAVLRLADAAGCSQVIFVEETEPALAKIRKTARSTDASVQFEVISEKELSQRIALLPPLIAVELTTTSKNLFEVSLPSDCAFVIGSEQHGIPENILAKCASAVHIPMFGVNGSMNVTHALAIVLYEWRRQQSHQL